MLLVAIALLTSGVVPLAASAGEDACCASEDGREVDCPPGADCECCTVRAARTSAAQDLVPPHRLAVAVVTSLAEPAGGPSLAGVFHPPRG
jgi:hypothetical protein